MSNLRVKYAVLWHALLNTYREWKQLCKGQNNSYEILQLSHRLEKGLINKNPKVNWGWEKAKRLNELLNTSELSVSIKEIGLSVLNSFLLNKKKSANAIDEEQVKEFLSANSFEINSERSNGGVINCKSPQFSLEQSKVIENLFNSRHSTRSFRSEVPPKNIIKEAVRMALKCPSACNRQPFHVYIVSEQCKIDKIGKESGYKAPYYVYVTGDINAYTIDEFNDWIVSPSIFIAYLTLSLHSKGLGSCIIRKDLVYRNEYNKKVAEVCGYNANEKLICELIIGYYEEEYSVPISHRIEPNDIITFL